MSPFGPYLFSPLHKTGTFLSMATAAVAIVATRLMLGTKRPLVQEVIEDEEAQNCNCNLQLEKINF